MIEKLKTKLNLLGIEYLEFGVNSRDGLLDITGCECGNICGTWDGSLEYIDKVDTNFSEYTYNKISGNIEKVETKIRELWFLGRMEFILARDENDRFGGIVIKDNKGKYVYISERKIYDRINETQGVKINFGNGYIWENGIMVDVQQKKAEYRFVVTKYGRLFFVDSSKVNMYSDIGRLYVDILGGERENIVVLKEDGTLGLEDEDVDIVNEFVTEIDISDIINGEYDE